MLSKPKPLKRSFSNNCLQLNPIKLKSLQEARNEAKSSKTRQFSLTRVEIDQNVLETFQKSLSSSKPSEKPPEAQTTIKESDEFAEEKEENPKKDRRGLIFQKKQENKPETAANSSLSKPSKRQLSANKDTRSNLRSISKTKVQSSISTVLDIIESERNAKKRLTKEQEKGLISRLQGKSLFKFN